MVVCTQQATFEKVLSTCLVFVSTRDEQFLRVILMSRTEVQRSIRVDEDSRRAGTLEAERKMSEEEFYGANKGAPFAQV